MKSMASPIVSNPHHLSVIFGISGIVLSFMVYLAPLPTFWRIYRKKSTEGFQSIPYSVALFSAMLYLYYALVKGSNGAMLIAINIIGCAIETTYLIIYMIYAPSQAKMYTARLLILFNLGVYGLIILSTMLFSHGKLRAQVVGWICGVFSVCVFASPLSVMRLVIRTKSAEFLPIWLSFFLTICAVMWFFYGFLIGDFFIALPNVLGFLLGIAQMILYAIYKDARNKEVTPEGKLEELAIEIKLGGVIDIVHEDHQANKEAAQKIIAEQDGRNESSDV